MHLSLVTCVFSCDPNGDASIHVQSCALDQDKEVGRSLICSIPCMYCFFRVASLEEICSASILPLRVTGPTMANHSTMSQATILVPNSQRRHNQSSLSLRLSIWRTFSSVLCA